MSTGRNTTTRDRHRAVIRRQHPPCGICQQPIDYTLRYPDPQSFVVDHITPLTRGGTDELDNKQAAHRLCNSLKSNKTTDPLTPRRYITNRRWGATPTASHAPNSA